MLAQLDFKISKKKKKKKRTKFTANPHFRHVVEIGLKPGKTALIVK